EPSYARLRVERDRMRIAHGRIGNHVGRQLPRCRVEPNDPVVPVAREPDHSFLDDEVVRVRPRVDLEALEGAGLVVEIRDVVAVLSDEPDTTLHVSERITRARFGTVWDLPFLWVELGD